MIDRMKLAHHLIDDKLLLSVAPRAGHRTLLRLVESLVNSNIRYERIRDLPRLYSLNNTNIKKIKFVRNPYNRAVSSYFICCENITLKLWHNIELTQKQAKELSFEKFIGILETKDISQLNHHLSNQVEVDEIEKIKYNQVHKIENIEIEIQEILQKEKIYVDLLDFKKNGIRTKISSEPCYLTSFKELKKQAQNNHGWPDYEFFYNKDISKAVGKIYQTDLYDYSITTY